MQRWIRITLLLLSVAPFSGCGVFRTHPPPASSAVSIETPASVSGEWKGTVRRPSHFGSEGHVRMSIAPGGRYVAWSDRASTLTVDAGRLSLINGKLISDTKGLTSMFTLYQPHGKPVLVVDVIGKDGEPYYLELVPDKP